MGRAYSGGRQWLGIRGGGIGGLERRLGGAAAAGVAKCRSLKPYCDGGLHVGEVLMRQRGRGRQDWRFSDGGRGIIVEKWEPEWCVDAEMDCALSAGMGKGSGSPERVRVAAICRPGEGGPEEIERLNVNIFAGWRRRKLGGHAKWEG